jgi:hypothetical protein
MLYVITIINTFITITFYCDNIHHRKTKDNQIKKLTLRTLPPSVSRLSTQCENVNISEPYRPPRPVAGIAFRRVEVSMRLINAFGQI